MALGGLTFSKAITYTARGDFNGLLRDLSKLKTAIKDVETQQKDDAERAKAYYVEQMLTLDKMIEKYEKLDSAIKRSTNPLRGGKTTLKAEKQAIQMQEQELRNAERAMKSYQDTTVKATHRIHTFGSVATKALSGLNTAANLAIGAMTTLVGLGVTAMNTYGNWGMQVAKMSKLTGMSPVQSSTILASGELLKIEPGAMTTAFRYAYRNAAEAHEAYKLYNERNALTLKTMSVNDIYANLQRAIKSKQSSMAIASILNQMGIQASAHNLTVQKIEQAYGLKGRSADLREALATSRSGLREQLAGYALMNAKTSGAQTMAALRYMDIPTMLGLMEKGISGNMSVAKVREEYGVSSANARYLLQVARGQFTLRQAAERKALTGELIAGGAAHQQALHAITRQKINLGLTLKPEDRLLIKAGIDPNLPPNEIVSQLLNVLPTLPKDERSLYLTKFFGRGASQAALYLLASNQQKAQMAKMAQASGVVLNRNDIAGWGKFLMMTQDLKLEWQGFQIQLAKMFLPVAMKVLAWAQKIMPWLQKHITLIKDLAIGLSIFIATAKGLNLAVTAFGSLSKVMGGFSKLLGGGAGGEEVGLFGSIRSVMGLMGPWGLAIAGVATAFGLAYWKIKPFHDLVNSIGHWVFGGGPAGGAAPTNRIAQALKPITKIGSVFDPKYANIRKKVHLEFSHDSVRYLSIFDKLTMHGKIGIAISNQDRQLMNRWLNQWRQQKEEEKRQAAAQKLLNEYNAGHIPGASGAHAPSNRYLGLLAQLPGGVHFQTITRSGVHGGLYQVSTGRLARMPFDKLMEAMAHGGQAGANAYDAVKNLLMTQQGQQYLSQLFSERGLDWLIRYAGSQGQTGLFNMTRGAQAVAQQGAQAISRLIRQWKKAHKDWASQVANPMGNDMLNLASELQSNYGSYATQFVQFLGKQKGIGHQFVAALIRDINLLAKVGNYPKINVPAGGAITTTPGLSVPGVTSFAMHHFIQGGGGGTGTITNVDQMPWPSVPQHMMMGMTPFFGHLEARVKKWLHHILEESAGGMGFGNAAAVIRFAKQFLGVPYVWGGEAPGGFDCSGLMQYVFGHFGINLPRIASAQQKMGINVPLNRLRPGDMVFYGMPAHHVGLYIGGGNMIDAPHTGADVRIEGIGHPSDARRVLMGSQGMVAPGSAARIMNELAQRHHWNAAQVRAWQNVIGREDASYSLTATNPSSGAYGIAQFIRGASEYYSYGGNPNTLVGQLTAMANYIAGRYHNPLNAWSHEQAYHWYDSGGVLRPGRTLAYNGTGKNEVVFTHGQLEALAKVGSSHARPHISITVRIEKWMTIGKPTKAEIRELTRTISAELAQQINAHLAGT